MIAWIQNYQKSEGGFTMVEMMVTIAIVGILASVSIPVFLNQRKVAVDNFTADQAVIIGTLATSLRGPDPAVELNETKLRQQMATIPGTTVTMVVIPESTDGFCLGFHNPQGKTWISSTQFITYDSVLGVGEDGGACPEGISTPAE